MKILLKIKKILKSNKTIYEFYQSLGVKYEYGYIHSTRKVNKLLIRLNKKKTKKIGHQYSADKKDVFIFIGDKNIDSTMRVAVFGDIDQGNVKHHECYYYSSRELKNPSLSNIHKLFFKINKYIPLPLKACWDKAYTTDNIQATTDKNMFIVFMVGPYYEETYSQPNLLNKINHFSDYTYCKKIMYLVDPIDKYPMLSCWFPYFDEIFGYSIGDTKKHNIGYIDSPCTLIKNYRKIESGTDIYIRCMDAGRAVLIKSCYEYLRKFNVNCDFHVQTTEFVIKENGLDFSNHRVAYAEMIAEEMASNVLLEVIIPGVASGPTLRYKEAVMYGKKLLTNNPSIFELPCYDPKYMKVFSKPSDIDVEWLLKKESVVYNYNEEFSVDYFCDQLKTKLINTSTGGLSTQQ